jgi:nucleotide-binding universal stress UspA family protein
MINLRQILVPTDFSEPSANALRYARAFAESFGAALHLLHVVDEITFSPYAWIGPEGGVPLAGYEPRAEVEQQVRERLGRVLTSQERERFRARLELRVGSPFVEIVRYARAEGIDLIVMGTHGRGPIAHMLIGSVAEKVVRKAPCPVLTVRHPEHEFVLP